MVDNNAIIKKLRKIIDSKGLSEGDDYLSSIWDPSNVGLIVPLMLLRDYTDDTEYLDEMWIVIHTIEGYPREAFIHQFVTNLTLLTARSPYLVEHMIHRIKNNEPCLQNLIEELRLHKPENIDPFMIILDHVREVSADVPSRVAAVDKIIKVIKE